MDISEIISFLVQKCTKNRHKGKHNQSYQYIVLVLRTFNKDINNFNFDGIPSQYYAYVYKLLEEFTIIGFYLNRKKEGIRIMDKLLLDYKTPFNIINKGQIENNQRYYMVPLDGIAKNKKRIQIKCDPDYIETNPSIIRVTGGFIMNCRTVNYGVKPGGIYYSRSPDGIVNTKNYILRLDESFNILSQTEIIDQSVIKRHANNVIGLEDVIIFEYHGKLWFTCTTLDTTPKHAQISLGSLTLEDTFINTSKFVVRDLRPINLLDPNRDEKNWLHFIQDDKIMFVYSYSPTIVRELTDGTSVNADTKLFKSSPTLLNFSRFRGSGGPLKFIINDQEYWLIVIHEVSWCGDKSRIYTHRFVLFNSNFEIVKISDPWYFREHGIEFCRSICDFNESIVLTCGLKDSEAWCYVLEKSKIIELLRDLNDYVF